MADTKPTFLYVEDDALSREVMELIITKVMQFDNFTSFPDSKDFEARLEALAYVPNVIFLDIHLQPLDGYQLLKILRNNPKYRAAKIIAITASLMSFDISQLQKAGFDGLIGKPIMQDVFPDILTRLLAGETVWHIP